MMVLLLLLGIVPVSEPLVDYAELVEVNHFYDDNGKLVFDQVIFWEWVPERSRFDVIGWRLLKRPSQRPHRNWARRGTYDALWIDGDTFRRVSAESFRETWTFHDPELVARKDLAKEQRRDLYTPRMVQARRGEPTPADPATRPNSNDEPPGIE